MKETKAGKVEYRVDKTGVIHAAVGKVSFEENKIVDNTRALIEAVAKAKKISLQHESVSRYSGTDTDVIFNVKEGIPSALVSFPLRYMHSVVEMADLRDVEKTVELLVAFIESVTEDDDFAHKL